MTENDLKNCSLSDVDKSSKFRRFQSNLTKPLNTKLMIHRPGQILT